MSARAESWRDWTPKKARLAEVFLSCRAVQFDSVHVHGTEAPVVVNLKTKAYGGPLREDVLELLGDELYTLASDEMFIFDSLVCTPRLEDLADAFLRSAKKDTAYFSPLPLPNIVRLEEDEEGETRRIRGVTDGVFNSSDLVLLVGGALEDGTRELQAIDALQGHDFIANDVVAVIDCGKGGRDALADYRFTVSSLFMLEDLLRFYTYRELVPEKARVATAEYLKRQRR